MPSIRPAKPATPTTSSALRPGAPQTPTRSVAAKGPPPFVTPRMDPKPMRRDQPKIKQTSTKFKFGPRRFVAPPAGYDHNPSLEKLDAVIAASTKSDGTAKPGYALRLRHALATKARLTTPSAPADPGLTAAPPVA